MLTEASRPANFTNEAGVDGTVRYLRNVIGLWLLQECRRHWGPTAAPLDSLAAGRGRRATRCGFVIDADDPGSCARTTCRRGSRHGWPHAAGRRRTPGRGRPVHPRHPGLAYRRAMPDAAALSGRHADVVHLVGGGSRNELLCQLTADATGLPVVAGPVEATALGNVLVQARALGAAPGFPRKG